MSAINLSTLRHTATLARIKLSPAEEKTFLPQLSAVLDYIDIIKKVDTKGIEPSFQVPDLPSFTRSDEIISPNSSLKSSYFKVKNTIKK